MAAASNKRRFFGVFFYMLRETGVQFPAIGAIGAAVGAYYASGVLRRALVVVGGLLGVLVIWDVLIAASGTIFIRHLTRWVDQRRAQEAQNHQLPELPSSA